jgi:NAD(P)-dependent dehydrogenase (short-subunit alcohol dehydrogenase family)
VTNLAFYAWLIHDGQVIIWLDCFTNWLQNKEPNNKLASSKEERMRGLRYKGVLITGGSRGIGKAAAQRFLEEGSRVFICGLEQAEVQGTVDEFHSLGPIDGLACNVGIEEMVHLLIQKAESFLQRIDILINNAGIAWEEPFLQVTIEHWDQIQTVNLRGVFLVAQGVAQRMVKDGKGGAIVNMSSTNGLVGEEKYAHYNASKGGVLLLTKTMAAELGRYGIRVNALCPGYILTPMSEAIDDPDFVAAYAREKIPLRRVGKPEEVAAAYAFLASDDASFINGEGLVVDGGQLAA